MSRALRVPFLKKFAGWLALSAVALCWAGIPRAAVAAPRDRPNVLLISLDTLRADRLGCYGHRYRNTPYIDMFASQGVVFESAHSNATYTLPAHATLFNSRLPWTHQVLNLTYSVPISKLPLTLAECYRREGYSTVAFTDGNLVSGRYGFSKGFDAYEESDPYVKTRKWLEDNYGENGAGKGKPFFLFFHTYAVSRMGSIKIHARYDCRLDEKFLNIINDLYDVPLPVVDNTVNHLFRILKSLNLYDSTLIVLTSDHGDSLCEEHNDGKFMNYAHGLAPYAPQTHVPLIIKVPEKFYPDPKLVQRVGEVVGLVDVAPTMLELSGIRIPGQFQGRSLVSGMRGKKLADEPHFSIGLVDEKDWRRSAVAVLYKGKKYIHYVKAPDQDEFYDLERDPMETLNLVTRRKQEADRYKNMLLSEIKSGGWNKDLYGESERTAVDNELINSMKTLGYLE